MLCLDSVALWHGGIGTESEHYEQAGSIREREESAGKRCHASATLGSGQA